MRATRVAEQPAVPSFQPVATAPDVEPPESTPAGDAAAPRTPATRVASRDANNTAAPATPVSGPGRVPEVQLAVATLTADYDREITRLRRLMDGRRDQLDPVTVAIIERNLAVIDTAIAESKAAIVRDPASRFLIESLNQSLQTKVELMRTAAVLPSRT